MMDRSIKQIIFGAFYLGFLVLILGALFFVFRVPIRPEEGELKLKPIEVNWVKHFSVGPENIGLLAEILNPNFEHASKEFFYKFEIFDSFGILRKKKEASSFIYAGERKYIIEPILEFPSLEVKRVKFSIIEPLSWVSSNDFKKPELSLSSLINLSEEERFKVKGFVLNEEALSVEKVKIIVYFFDLDKNLLAASSTFFRELKGGEEKPFVVVFSDFQPKPETFLRKTFVEAMFK